MKNKIHIVLLIILGIIFSWVGIAYLIQWIVSKLNKPAQADIPEILGSPKALGSTIPNNNSSTNVGSYHAQTLLVQPNSTKLFPSLTLYELHAKVKGGNATIKIGNGDPITLNGLQEDSYNLTKSSQKYDMEVLFSTGEDATIEIVYYT